MSTRKPSPNSRSVRPVAEALEDRQMLSAVVSGTDPQGDHWTLKLIGPGTINVSQPDGTTFTHANADTPAEIGTITVAGTDGVASRLVGTVLPGAGSDGRVFFQFLRETGGGEQPQIDSSSPIGAKDPVEPKNGLLAIHMPNFWLGNTPGTVPTASQSSLFSAAPPALAGAIEIPDGVSTLDFGGVDTTFTPAGGTPLNTDSQNDQFQVNLGTPVILGTSIIINRSITSAQAGTPASGSTPAGNPTQDSVYFLVAGRLNLFQANEIDGNTSFVPTQFTATAGATSGTTPGGTFVISGTGSPPFFSLNGSTSGALTGQIGFVRIGGNATNFTTMVYDNSSPGQSIDARISDFSISGETSHVLLVAPNGSRNIYFGKGMDQVQINSQVIDTLQANRGALNSTVTTTDGINSINIGGDVVNTNVQSGYQLNSFASLISNVATSGAPVPTITNRLTNTDGSLAPQTIGSGHINARIAGDVVNSVFSASVEPNPSFNPNTDPGTFTQPNTKVFPFGSPANIIYPTGVIKAKVEGKIDNSTNTLVDSSQPNQAFFAKYVNLKAGPTVPPAVPEEPFPATVYHQGQRGVKPVQINNAVVHPTGALALKSAKTRTTK